MGGGGDCASRITCSSAVALLARFGSGVALATRTASLVDRSVSANTPTVSVAEAPDASDDAVHSTNRTEVTVHVQPGPGDLT